MGNRWKVAFFALLVVFVALMVSLVAVYEHYLPSAKKTDFSVQDQINPDEPIFTITSTKQQLQALVNDKLGEYSGKSNVQYHVEMKDNLVLKGTLNFLGSDIEFAMELTPKVVDGGNMVLKEQSIRLGTFNLPVSRVMQYVQNSTKLPDWITILPDKEEVYVSLQDIHIEDQFYLKAQEFDLQKNQIKFSLYGLSKKQSNKQ